MSQAKVIDGTAPDFTLPALAGSGQVSLSGFRGHIVVLNFWANWCEPCIREAPGLEAVARSYPSALSFQAKCGVTHPSAFEPSAELAERYRLVGLPTTVVIGPDGDPLYPPTCYLDLQALSKTLDPLTGSNSGQVSA